MNIREDRSYLDKDYGLWIKTGCAKETVQKLLFSYCFTEEDLRREELACIGKSPEEQFRIRKDINTNRSRAMKALMDNIAARFVVYQYGGGSPVPFNSAFWELLFWCNRQKEPPYGLDYSHFTLGFNEHQPPEWRMLIWKHVLDFLMEYYKNQPNLEVTTQYTVWYDISRIRAEAQKITASMKDQNCRFLDKRGKLVLDGDRLWFKPQSTKTRLHYVSDTDLLRLSWALEPTEEELLCQT